MRVKVFLTAVVVVGCALVVLFAAGRKKVHTLHIKANFADVNGLRPGAPVELAGVEVGRVTGVRVNGEQPQNPVEVSMLLQTPYDVKLPSDAVVSIETAGLLGGTMAVIDIKGASGPVAADNATLKAVSAHEVTAVQVLNCLSSISEHKTCATPQAKSEVATPSGKGH